MILTEEVTFVQLPFLVLADMDDLYLENDEDGAWFHALRNLAWEDFREIASTYYEQLYAFNAEAARARQVRRMRDPNPETQDEAQLRLLEERPTGGNEEAPILYPEQQPERPQIRIDPQEVAPGRTPDRLAGKKPKCFFALFRAFIGVSLMGKPPEVDEVHFQLVNNPAFARACGFTLPDTENKDNYRQTDIPSRRKLEQFDQIMCESGLWSRAKWEEVARNLEEGVIEYEKDLTADTSHYHACSQFETVTVEGQDGEERRKSQSKTIKKCRCEDRENCEHPWELADEGAGTVVKQKNQKHWAHKTAVIGYPRQGVPLDACAVADAATHDGKTLVPHIKRLHDHLPEVVEEAERVLADSAYDSEENREGVAQPPFELELYASLNPRNRKTRSEDLPRGMAKVTPRGEVICQAGHAMDYRGVRWETERYIYGPPQDEEGLPHCLSCFHRQTCLKADSMQRTVTIGFDLLPHIDPSDPPMAKSFRSIMKLRPAVERMIKMMKCDFGDGRAHKRGNAAFQGLLDKTMIALHIQLRRNHAIL